MTAQGAHPKLHAAVARRAGVLKRLDLLVLFPFFSSVDRVGGVRFPAIFGVAALLASCGDPLIEEAETAVRTELRDPDSAKFSDVERCGTSNVVMGKVNSKNAYGGYAGRENFYYADGQADLGFSTNLHKRCMAAMAAQTDAIRATLPPEVRAQQERTDAELAARYGIARDGSSVPITVPAKPAKTHATTADEPEDFGEVPFDDTAKGLNAAANEAEAAGDEEQASNLRNLANSAYATVE
jgi:hypothetical protein